MNQSQEQDRLARFEQTVVPHLDAAYNLSRWLTRNDSDAQDVVQEAYLRALKFFGGYHGVLKEQLVEISEPEEQKCRGMLFLDGSVLPHQRSGRLIHRAGFGGL